MAQALTVEEAIPAKFHRLTESGSLLVPALHLLPPVAGETVPECGPALVELRTPSGGAMRVEGRIMNAVLPLHVSSRVLVVAATADEIPRGTTARLLDRAADSDPSAPYRCGAIVSRKPTEPEVLSVDAAFEEHLPTGSTNKRCPWCLSDLRFKWAGASYAIDCTFCEFRVTSRGM